MKIEELIPEITKKEQDDFRKRLDTVLFSFAHNFPFWGVLSERCKYSLTRNPVVTQTACVTHDGHIIFNLDFVQDIPDKHLLFLVAHEISHFVFEHAFRIGDREHRKFNVATDYSINLMLHYQFNNMSYVIDKVKIVWDKSWSSSNTDDHRFAGLTAEAIYRELDNDKDNPYLKNKGDIIEDIISYIFGEQPKEGVEEIRDRRIPLPSKENKTPEAAQQEMKDYLRKALTEAFTIAKSQGQMSANFERAIVKLLKPRIDWVTALRQKIRFGISRMEKRDYTWLRPNKRFTSSGFVLPSYTGPESPKICYAIDTSGSMSEEDLTKAMTELDEIRKRFNAKVYFCDCDASVYSSRYIHPNEELPKLSGGGGTDFAPVFDHLLDKKIKPDYCIFFTDGEGHFGEDPKLDVLWVLTNNHVKPPFGQVIRYNDLQES